MKAMSFPRIGCLGVLMAAGGFAVAQEKKQEEPAAVTYLVDVSANTTAKAEAGTFVKVDDPEAAALAQFGAAYIERVGGMLVTEVNRELATKDVVDAIEAMHLKNFELPKQQPGQPKITAIKRTSSMLRDPANTPDAADKAALDKIYLQLMNNEMPDKVIVQKIALPGQPVEWRVSRPIATTQSCLACHGNPEKFEPAVRAVLARRYPEDKAVDYSRQEYRGVIRVSLQGPAKK